jgi:glycosyltransferase involved in cell wall biosynthesis
VNRPLPVTVVIPAHNAARTLGQALHSVYTQTRRPAEVIVVDDGSTDATVKVVRSRRPPPGTRLKLIRQANAGAAAARNHGILAARQPYLAFLDADDWWAPAKLAICHRRLARSRAALLCHGFHRAGGAGGNIMPALRGHPALTALYLRNFIGTSTVMLRRAALARSGLFDPRLSHAEDHHLWLSLLAADPAGLVIEPMRLAAWRDHPASLSKNAARLYLATLRLAWRHWPSLRRHAAHPWALLALRLALIHAQLLRSLLAPAAELVKETGRRHL